MRIIPLIGAGLLFGAAAGLIKQGNAPDEYSHSGQALEHRLMHTEHAPAGLGAGRDHSLPSISSSRPGSQYVDQPFSAKEQIPETATANVASLDDVVSQDQMGYSISFEKQEPITSEIIGVDGIVAVAGAGPDDNVVDIEETDGACI